MKKFKESFELLSKHVKRHNGLMIIASSVVTVIALFFTIYWNFDNNDISPVIDTIYLAGHIFFLVISLALTLLLVLSRHIKFKMHALVVFIHVYVFLLIAWGTYDCVLDLTYGYSPMFYLMLFTLVAGLFVVEPLFFGVIVTSSFATILTIVLKNSDVFFSGPERAENIATFIIFIVIILLIAGEHFGITVNDHRIEKRLEQLTYFDDLTGLLNERSYLKEIEELDALIEAKKLKEYAVILMDLNNLKATNDAYGHRYGCHLVVRCGKTLPTLFQTSKLFHIGGDEYVAIVYGEDYKNFEKVIDNLKDKLSYSLVEFDGQTLIFSVAHGYAKYEEGLKYKDVLQKADKEMYANKKMLKEKYGMAKR